MAAIAVIQARMSSSRLPGKVLLPLGDSTILGWVIRAASQARLVDTVVVATSTDEGDEAVAVEARRHGAEVVRGPLEDVLARYIGALDAFPSDVVVRLTADCPLLDPRVIDQCIAVLTSDDTLDITTNCLVRSHPRGLDVEAVRAAALRRAAVEATGFHRAHVTSWIMERPQDYGIAGIVSALDAGDLRVTVDTDADLEVVRRIVAALGTDAQRCDTLVEWLRRHPDVAQGNAHVQQKAHDQG